MDLMPLMLQNSLQLNLLWQCNHLVESRIIEPSFSAQSLVAQQVQDELVEYLE